MEKGITLIGVTEIQPTDNRPMIDKSQGLYPTGSLAVITEEAAHRIFNQDIASELIEMRRGYLEDAVLLKLLDASSY